MPPPAEPIASTELPSVVVVGDLAGDDGYHAGDEAMAESTIELVRALYPDGVRVVATSADPAATAARLHCDAVAWTGFAGCATEAERHALAERLRPPTPPGSPLLAEVAGADAVVIAGGGNLNSNWPEHLYERLAVARTAAANGVPVVVTGQTLGPELNDHHRPLVAELAGLAAMVGVREHRSLTLAGQLGINNAVAQADDALLLAGARPVLPGGFDPGPATAPRRYLAVTVHPFATAGDPRMESLAAQLATVARRIVADVVFVPHARAPEGPGGTADVDVARRLAELTGGVAIDPVDARAAVWVVANAWAVVSTRYHPLVFATAAGVPALAVLWDDYTAVKCRGALDHVGLGDWWVGVGAACDGALEPALAELTRRRHELASWMALARPHLDALDQRRINAVAAGLNRPSPAGGPPDTAATRPVPTGDAPIPAGSWADVPR